MCLKPYFEPEERPTNPPEQLVNNNDETGPDKLDPVQKTIVSEDAEIGNNGKKQTVWQAVLLFIMQNRYFIYYIRYLI